MGWRLSTAVWLAGLGGFALLGWALQGFATEALTDFSPGGVLIGKLPLAWLSLGLFVLAAAFASHEIDGLVRDLLSLRRQLHWFRLFRTVATQVSFAAIDTRTKTYLDAALLHLEKGRDLPVRAIEGIIHCGAINLLQLARRVLGADAVPFLVPNILVFDSATRSLIVSLSADLQSFDSVQPWELKAELHPTPAQHAGICVRAYLTGAVQVVPSMAGEALRKDEDIKAMISIPLLPASDAADGALAVINVNAFAPGVVPGTLDAETQERIASIRERGRQLNRLIALAAKGPDGRAPF